MDVSNLRVLPLSFYRDGSRTIANLSPAATYLAIGPTEPGSHPTGLESTYPPIQVRAFDNVEAVEFSSALLRRNTVYIPDYCETHQDTSVHETFFLIKHTPERIALTLKGARPRGWNGIMLFQIGAFNWYHWLIEILPMAFLAERLPDQYAIYPFIIPQKIAQIETFRDSLGLFLNGRKTSLIDEKGCLFKELIVIDPITNGPNNLREGAWPTKEMFSYNQKLLIEFRNAILERLNIEQKEPSELIFLARENDRRAFNQDEIENIAIRNGFRLVYMEKLSFREQVELMFGAKIIVGASGAAFSNILFCQKGARVLSW